MKRKRIKRSSPEAIREWRRSSKPLSRSGRIKPIGERRKRDRKEGRVFGDLCERVRDMDCCISGRRPVDPHHVKHRSAGWGDYLPNGDGNVVPLHRDLHRELHQVGRATFEKRYGVDLEAIAKEIAYLNEET